MSLMEYREMVDKIVEGSIEERENIYDFEGVPLEDEFNRIFEFYIETFKQNAHFGISPFLFYFKNDIAVNAAAGKLNEYYVVFINSGVVVKLHNQFKASREITNLINQDFLDFEESLDVELKDLMYQTVIHFTFYHELAHLVQKSKLLENKLYEITNDANHSFNIYRHILELDADQYSSICLGTHLVQYSQKMFGNGITSDQFEKLAIVMCSAVFCYFLLFNEKGKKMYYEENTHPHPIIRITCVVLHVVEYCLQHDKLKNVICDLKSSEIVKKCLSFSKNILVQNGGEKVVDEYLDVLRQEASSIVAYLSKLRQLEEGDTSLASYKWNEYVKALK